MGFKIEATPVPSCGAHAFNCCAALPDGKVLLVPEDHPSLVLFDPADKSCEDVGRFDGGDKFRNCAVLPDGKVLLVPYCYPSLVLFNPADKSCEDVGHFDGTCTFSSCAVLADGKVLLVPRNYPSLVLFDPADKSCEDVGRFDGTVKFRTCAALPDGKVLLVPRDHPSLVLFDPADKSCEEVGHFDGTHKFSSCAALPDGKVLLVPSFHPSLVLFDPAGKSCEEVGHFDDDYKFSSCAVLPDGKVLLVPDDYPSLVLFDPADKSCEEVCHFDGNAKFSTCAALPDGKVLLVPQNYPAVVLFNPIDKSCAEVGNFDEKDTFQSCAVTADGKVVLAPWISDAVVVVSAPTWTFAAMNKRTKVQASKMGHAMWKDRCFTDATVVAGDRQVMQKTIPVHRAVLASRSEFFHSLFSSPFREATDSSVYLPEHPDIVEAALQHIYTGRLPEVDILELLPLAHRLGLEDCVVDCTASMHLIPRDHIAHALRVLRPLKGHPAVDAAWDQLVQRVRDEEGLLDGVLEALAGGHGPEPRKHEPLGIAAATQTCAQPGDVVNQWSDEAPRCLQEAPCNHDESQEVQTAPDQPSPSGYGSSPQLPFSQFMVLHLHRCPTVLSQVLRDSPLGQDLVRRGVDIAPSWASGAKVFIDGFRAEDLRSNGHDPALLRPWHVVSYVEDVPRILEALRRLPYHQRPRPKAKQSLRGLVGSRVRTEPARFVPSASLSSFSEEQPAVPGRALAGEPVARIDTETADAIAKAIAASFLEEHYLTGGLAAPLQVERTFVSVQEGVSSCSPRTHLTA